MDIEIDGSSEPPFNPNLLGLFSVLQPKGDEQLDQLLAIYWNRATLNDLAQRATEANQRGDLQRGIQLAQRLVNLKPGNAQWRDALEKTRRLANGQQPITN